MSNTDLRSKSNIKPADEKLWDRARQEADKVYEKPSAYKSGFMVRWYKKNGGKFKVERNSNNKKPPLKRWFEERWRNQRGEEGYKYKSDVYRPTKRVNKNTPTTFDELSKKEINKARSIKYRKGRVSNFKDQDK